MSIGHANGLLKKVAKSAMCAWLLMLWAGSAWGQVSVSPTDLSFGIPTTTMAIPPAPSSAPQAVYVNMIGTSSITFTGVTITQSGSDFAMVNSCTGTIAPPNTCEISVSFTDSLAPAPTLETATLNINYTINETPQTITVPMNGAYGAIELFGAININNSLFSGTTWPNSAGNPVKSIPVNLSCPASPTAILSSTPDGLSNVFQDNTIQVTNTYGTTPTTVVTANVCYGGDTNFEGFTGFPAGTSNCFQPAYESAASGFVGQNPDLASGLIQTYGVQPLNLMTPPNHNVDNDNDADDHHPLYPPVLVAGMQQLTVQLTDAGGFLGAGTLHLVTNCTLAGVTSGGSITGNPITTNPGSQTQTFTFDSGGRQNISFTSSQSVAIQQGTSTANGVVPIVTDIGISQTAFAALIANTSAAPAVCLRMSGELDSLGNALCKGYLVQCFNPADGTTSGDNCNATTTLARNLYDSAQFTSPDTPPGTNYLGSSCQAYIATITNNAVLNGSCVASSGAPGLPGPNPTTLIGPGMLMGGDTWLPNGTCTLTGVLAGDLCPLDPLTQFKGAADPLPGSTVPGRNSVYVPVVNMPLPFTQVAIGGQNANGWVNSGSVTANFVSNAATYTPAGSNNPPLNGFTGHVASPYSLTYGVTNAVDSNGNPVPVPDTTYPVPGDITNYNAGVNQNYKAPLCPSGTPNPFNSTASLTELEGVYNLHYFTTDCALSEELWFNPSGTQLTDPTANWASFPTQAFGVDTQAPELSCTTSPAPVFNNTWYNSNVTVSCNASDDFSGFAPGTAVPNTNGTVLKGSLTETLSPIMTSVSAGSASTVNVNVPVVSDLAGNPSNQISYTFSIDRQAPTFGGPTFAPMVSGNKYLVGQGTVTISYSCSDGAGSGVAFCTGQGLPTGTTTTCTAPGATVSCSSSFTPSASNVGSYSFSISAQDNVGNPATSSPVGFSVSYATASVVSGALPALAVPGTNLVYLSGVANNNPASNPVPVYGATVSVQLQMPSSALGTGSIQALYADITCTNFPSCLATPKGGASCSVTTSTVSGTTTISASCPVGTLNDIYTSKSGAVVAVIVPIASKAPAGKTITANGMVTALSPITGTPSFKTTIPIF